MVYVKMIRNTSGGTEYIKRLHKYIVIDRLTGEIRKDFVYMSGYGVDCADFDYAYHQMVMTQEYFGKVGYNPLVHYMVCFDHDVKDKEKASRLASLIADYFRNDHQLIWGIHHKPRKSGEYHVHYLVNAVNYRNGTMIHSYKPDVKEFAEYIYEVTHFRVRYSVMGYEDDLK